MKPGRRGRTGARTALAVGRPLAALAAVSGAVDGLRGVGDGDLHAVRHQPAGARARTGLRGQGGHGRRPGPGTGRRPGHHPLPVRHRPPGQLPPGATASAPCSGPRSPCPTGVAAPVAGPGIEPGLLGTAPRTDGTTQITYNGWPLYLWPPDRTPGKATGQGLTNAGGRWYVVDTAGNAVTTAVRTRARPAGQTGGHGRFRRDGRGGRSTRPTRSCRSTRRDRSSPSARSGRSSRSVDRSALSVASVGSFLGVASILSCASVASVLVVPLAGGGHGRRRTPVGLSRWVLRASPACGIGRAGRPPTASSRPSPKMRKGTRPVMCATSQGSSDRRSR